MVQSKLNRQTILFLIIMSLALFNVFGLTILDYVSNKIMFEHGLIFSWKWFLPWGIGLIFSMLGYAITGSLLYWIFRKKDKKRYFTAFLIFLTNIWQIVSGNEDWIWFLIFDRQFPPLNKIWWWMPQHWIPRLVFSNWTWTTLCQIFWSIGMNGILLGLWIYWFMKDRRLKYRQINN